MGLMDFWKKLDINEGARRALDDPNGLLVDVREPDEYAAGHIPGSVNFPLDSLGANPPTQGRALYVYCHSGARSARAVAWLSAQGYAAENIGGITAYTGALERGGAEQ